MKVPLIGFKSHIRSLLMEVLLIGSVKVIALYHYNTHWRTLNVIYNDDCKIIYIEGKLKYHVIEGFYDEMGGEFTVLRLLPFGNVLRYASIYSVSVSFMVSEAKYIDH